MTLRSLLFSAIFAIAALFVAPRARADDDHEPIMSSVAFGGWAHSPRGASVPVGYSLGFTVDQHLYAGMAFAATLGPFEAIGNDSTGQPTSTLDVGILFAGEIGYEEVVDDHLLVRGALGLGGYFWSRQRKPDDIEDRIRSNGLAVTPSVLVGALFGPLLFGVQTRGLVGSMNQDTWSVSALFVVGAHFELK